MRHVPCRLRKKGITRAELSSSELKIGKVPASAVAPSSSARPATTVREACSFSGSFAGHSCHFSQSAKEVPRDVTARRRLMASPTASCAATRADSASSGSRYQRTASSPCSSLTPTIMFSPLIMLKVGIESRAFTTSCLESGEVSGAALIVL